MNKRVKSILTLILALLMVFSCLALTGCDKDDDDDDDDGDDKKSSQSGDKAANGAPSSPEDALNLYWDASAECDPEALEHLAPKVLWDYIEETYGVDAKAVKKYFKDELADDNREDMEDEYGKNYKVTFTLEDEEAVSENDFDAIKDYVNDNFGISKNEIEEAVVMSGSMALKGSEKTEEDEGSDLYALKIDGGWYFVSVYISDGEAYVSFPIVSLAEMAANDE